MGSRDRVVDLLGLPGPSTPSLLADPDRRQIPIGEPTNQRCTAQRLVNSLTSPDVYAATGFGLRRSLLPHRCIASFAFSRRPSRCSSARSLSRSRPSPPSRARRSLATELPKMASMIPNSRATRSIGLPVSLTIRTAPSLTWIHLISTDHFRASWIPGHGTQDRDRCRALG